MSGDRRIMAKAAAAAANRYIMMIAMVAITPVVCSDRGSKVITTV